MQSQSQANRSREGGHQFPANIGASLQLVKAGTIGRLADTEAACLLMLLCGLLKKRLEGNNNFVGSSDSQDDNHGSIDAAFKSLDHLRPVEEGMHHEKSTYERQVQLHHGEDGRDAYGGHDQLSF